MNSTPTAIEPDETLAARADARLAHAYEQLARADEQIARVTERLSKLDHDDPQDASAVQGRRRFRGSTAVRGVSGLVLGACIVIAAFVAQSPGDKAKPNIARAAPQPVATSSLQSEKPKLPAQFGPSPVEVAAAADPPTAQAAPAAASTPQVATPQPQTATPQGPAPAAATATAQAELLESMSHDLANLTQQVEQLKANQEQIASDNAKAIEQLKAGQEQVASDNARAIEQLKASQEQVAGDNARAIEQLKAGQEQTIGLITKVSEQTASKQKVSQQNQRPKIAANKPVHAPRQIAAPTRRAGPPPSPQARAQPPARAPLQPDDQ